MVTRRAAMGHDIGQWVNLWADHFCKAEYIMQLDSNTVFNFPVTRRTLFDMARQPSCLLGGTASTMHGVQ